MLFIADPEIFWNHAETPVKRLVQQFIAPNGLPYNSRTGFGTIEDLQSYLLISKIGGKSAEKVDLVGGPGTSWNRIKGELIRMYEITMRVNSSDGLTVKY